MSGVAGLLLERADRLEILLLAVGRFAGMVALAPVFGAQILPARVRMGLALYPAVAVLPVLLRTPLPDDLAGASAVALLAMCCREAVVGLAIGLAAQLVIGGALLGAQLAGLQMGLGMANLIDPQTHDQVTTFAQWQQVVAILLFLAVDAHHQLLRVVAASFAALPIGTDWVSSAGLLFVVTLARGCFRLAIEIAAPVLVVVLLVNGALGALSKLVPQLNVMAVGFGLNVAAGVFVLILAQPASLRVLEAAYAALGPQLEGLVLRLG